ncbi:hypothetical protein FOZ60_008766 [Perkinsus olseni]|uniref:Uncharacterized protein n=1 Tax=Perkinsus olseni TaxID=32597 RepID=A0A7J6NJL5_PEROL|nr:hypothetical protein FOZ60_008766 [Perkinsus olseni]
MSRESTRSTIENRRPPLEASALFHPAGMQDTGASVETTGQVTGFNNNPPWGTSMVTLHEAIQPLPATIIEPLPMPAVYWEPSNTDEQLHETYPQMDSQTTSTTPTITPALGLYFNEQATEQLNTVSLEVSSGEQQTLDARLTLFCTTTRCFQSTLNHEKPKYFKKMSLKRVAGLAFTPPIFRLTRADDACFLIDPNGRDDDMEISDAFMLAGYFFEISNFMTATIAMCWAQDRRAWDLQLGLKIDKQKAVSPDCIVQLRYANDEAIASSLGRVGQLAGSPSQARLHREFRSGKVLGGKLTSAIRQNEGASPAKQAKSGV